jgi:hypothetical protein
MGLGAAFSEGLTMLSGKIGAVRTHGAVRNRQLAAHRQEKSAGRSCGALDRRRPAARARQRSTSIITSFRFRNHSVHGGL